MRSVVITHAYVSFDAALGSADLLRKNLPASHIELAAK
jgi:hypothetical protein